MKRRRRHKNNSDVDNDDDDDEQQEKSIKHECIKIKDVRRVFSNSGS